MAKRGKSGKSGEGERGRWAIAVAACSKRSASSHEFRNAIECKSTMEDSMTPTSNEAWLVSFVVVPLYREKEKMRTKKQFHKLG